MIAKPPFYLHGEAGKALGPEGYSFEVLGIQQATLSLRSLDADELTFSLRAKPGRVVPDDEQWVTLRDDAGTALFTGICKRTFSYLDRIYSYTAANVYKGLMETPLLGNDGRPFLLYTADRLENRLRDILLRAGNAGLPIQPPPAAEMPPLYLIPKMAFRAASYASALEDLLKWAPDVVSRMDYSTSPPTLRFASRATVAETVIDLDSDAHHGTDVSLTPQPEARALGVSLSYARRSGDSLIIALDQQAGDPQAEARRKLSIFLSGVERSDALVSDALTSAQLALIKINELITVTGASVDAAAATAGLALDWTTCVARDSNLLAAATAQSGFTMFPGGSRSYFNQIYEVFSTGYRDTSQVSYTGTPLYLSTATGAVATGWYAVNANAFTSAQLATAGATQDTRYIRGELFAERSGSTGRNTGMQSLWDAAPAQCSFINGYTQNTYNSAFESISSLSRAALWYRVNIPVFAINKSPSAVAAAVKAAAAGTQASGFIERAEFVEAPPDLAANYFSRQDWTPYRGALSFTPRAPVVPLPGDFVSVRGQDVESGWPEMKAPVAECQLDLQTLSCRVALGPSPRMNFSSLVDRLRIPQEDNYEPG
jgi:hypothetical protein